MPKYRLCILERCTEIVTYDDVEADSLGEAFEAVADANGEYSSYDHRDKEYEEAVQIQGAEAYDDNGEPIPVSDEELAAVNAVFTGPPEDLDYARNGNSHIITLSNGQRIELSESKMGLAIGTMAHGEIDATWICNITPNGVLSYPNSGEACKQVALGLPHEKTAEVAPNPVVACISNAEACTIVAALADWLEEVEKDKDYHTQDFYLQIPELRQLIDRLQPFALAHEEAVKAELEAKRNEPSLCEHCGKPATCMTVDELLCTDCEQHVVTDEERSYGPNRMK